MRNGLRPKLGGLWLSAWRHAALRTHVPRTGIRVRALAADAPVRSLIAWRPTWKTRVITTILRHRRGAFIDVGVNVGQTLLDYLQAPVRSLYVGFEPNPVCFQHLRELVALNALEDCTVYPAALSDRTGVETLHLFGGDTDPGASLLPNLRPDRETQSLPVCVYRFDELPDVLSHNEIALVKIDVEGAELKVLRGMERTIATKSPWILCEVLHRDERADPELFESRCDALIQLVDKLGYKAHRIIQDESGSEIAGLRAVHAFPSKVWDEHSSLECEYMLVPARESEALASLFPGLAIGTEIE